MEKYISKAAVVAEIEKLKDNCLFDTHAYNMCDDILSFLDTLEVKEVDFEKEFKRFLNEVEGVPSMWHSVEQIEWAKDLAKHFFKLELRVAQKEK